MDKVYTYDNPGIHGVQIHTAPSFSEDYRGLYRELWNKRMITVDGEPVQFVEADISCNYRNVLRGIHGDDVTGKLITCLHGRFYLVVVDARSDSGTKDQWFGITLTDKTFTSVYVPPGCGNGHLVLSDYAIFHYLQTRCYTGSEEQFTIAYDSPALDIYWPIDGAPITSERDKSCLNV